MTGHEAQACMNKLVLLLYGDALSKKYLAGEPLQDDSLLILSPPQPPLSGSSKPDQHTTAGDSELPPLRDKKYFSSNTTHTMNLGRDPDPSFADLIGDDKFFRDMVGSMTQYSVRFGWDRRQFLAIPAKNARIWVESEDTHPRYCTDTHDTRSLTISRESEKSSRTK